MAKKASVLANEDDFLKVYRDSVDEVMACMPKDWSAIAKHNIGWSQDVFDARQYLVDSEVRFLRAFRVFLAGDCKQLLDVGGFLAAFPLTMAKLGFSVTVAEKFDYYGGVLDNIAQCLSDNGISVMDSDFTLEGEACDGQFDAVTCMAVAEHLAHSPKPLMDNIRNVMSSGGHFVFEVPNLAFWPRRFSLFFRGRTVMAPIDEVFHSAVPFTGHHREYTIEDARYVLNQGGFAIIEEEIFNYGMENLGVKMQLFMLPARIFPQCAGVIFLHSQKR